MKNLIYSCLLLMPLALFNSCEQKSEQTVAENKENTPLDVEEEVVAEDLNQIATDVDIEAANKEGKAVFLVVTETGNTDNENAIALGNEAQKLQPNTVVIVKNISDEANKNIITKYRLSSAKTPLILIIATNGVVAAGSYYKNIAANELAALMPSPKKTEVLAYLEDENPVFVVVSKKNMNTDDVMDSCNKACDEMQGKAKLVTIDFDNAAEKEFLEELKITELDQTPEIYVINKQGQVSDSFKGITASKTLIASATKKPKSCCASGGSCDSKEK